MYKYLSLFILILTISSCTSKKLATVSDGIPIEQKTAASTVNINNIKSHIQFLASDELKGRDTGSEGMNIAAKYLATNLLRHGVKQFDNPSLDG